MENIKTMIAVLGAALPLLASCVTLLIKVVKSAKARAVLQGTLKLTEILQPLIVDAEQFLHYTGKEKKEFVLTRINRYALENRIRFDGQAVDGKIDELVETTKRVNSRDADARQKSAAGGQGKGTL